MTQTVAEILLFASLVTNAALLSFIAGVLRKVMNDLDESAFKQFVSSLVLHSKKSAFMLTVLNLPFIGAIPFFYVFGFRDRWLFAGLSLWLFAGLLAKMIKLPIYRAIATADAQDSVRLRKERRNLNIGNIFQAILNSAAALIAFVQFVA